MRVIVVRRNESDDGTEDQAVTDALKQPLCEEELPVASDERSAENGEYLHGTSYRQDVAEVACVKGAAREGADQVDEEDLYAAHPGDVAERSVESLDVVGLEEAPRANVAEDVKHNQMTGRNLSPCCPAGERDRLLYGGGGLEGNVCRDIVVVAVALLLIQEPGTGEIVLVAIHDYRSSSSCVQTKMVLLGGEKMSEKAKRDDFGGQVMIAGRIWRQSISSSGDRNGCKVQCAPLEREAPEGRVSIRGSISEAGGSFSGRPKSP